MQGASSTSRNGQYDAFAWPASTASGLATTPAPTTHESSQLPSSDFNSFLYPSSGFDSSNNNAASASSAGTADFSAFTSSSADFHPSLFDFSQADVDAIMSYPVTLTPVVENASSVGGSGSIFGGASGGASIDMNMMGSADWANFMQSSGPMADPISFADGNTGMNWDTTSGFT